MNFLAHIFLSGTDNDQLLIGNFIADFVRGKTSHSLPNDVKAGIILHRKIDAFTDANLTVKKGVQRLKNRYSKYSTVLIDVFFDHFLAINWNKFSNITLEDRAPEVYSVFTEHKLILPEKVQLFLPYMIKQNWLVNYAKIYGMERSLEGLSSRAKFDNELFLAINELKIYYSEYNEEFLEFFPQIIEYVNNIKHSILKKENLL